MSVQTLNSIFVSGTYRVFFEKRKKSFDFLPQKRIPMLISCIKIKIVSEMCEKIENVHGKIIQNTLTNFFKKKN